MTNLEIYKTLAKKYMKRCVCCDYSDNAVEGDKYATSYISIKNETIYVCDYHKLDVLQGLFSKYSGLSKSDYRMCNLFNSELIMHVNAMINYNESFELTDYEVMALLSDVIPKCKFCNNYAKSIRVFTEKDLVCSHCEQISKYRDIDSGLILGYSFEPILEYETLIKFINISDKIRESYEPIRFRR